jgi:hypothetical protein
MSSLPDPGRRGAGLHTVAHPEPSVGEDVAVVIAGHQPVGTGVAELWCRSVLLGMVHEERGGLVLRLESHARGPLGVNAVALERALAEARQRLTGATVTDESGCLPLAAARHDRPRAQRR